MDDHMAIEQVGIVGTLHRYMENINYNLFPLKERYYTINIINTYDIFWFLQAKNSQPGYGRTITPGRKRTRLSGILIPLPITLFINDYNNICHAYPSIDETWSTHRQNYILLYFIISVIEVNSYLAMKNWVCTDNYYPTLHQYQKKLYFYLIKNECLKG